MTDKDTLTDLIEKITERWYHHPNRKDIPISSVKKMITSLTQKTTAPKDGEVVEIKKDSHYDGWFSCPICAGRDIKHDFVYCPICGNKIKRID